MALEGNIETFYLSSLFQLLSNDKKTGKLRIANDDDVVTVNFLDGTIIFATSTENEKHLGNLLRSEGIIGDVELENYLLIAKNRKQRLGEVLVEECYISKEELTAFIRMQAENILFSLFMWHKGKFRFEDCPISFSENTDTQFDTMELILEASRRADELSEIQTLLPARDEILLHTAKASRADAVKNLIVQENAVFRLVNGTRTVRDIIHQSSYDEFTASKAIHTLLSEGLIEAKEKTDFSLTGDMQHAPPEPLIDHPPAEKNAAAFFDQHIQKSSQLQSMYEKNLKPAPRKKRRSLGIPVLLLMLVSAATVVLFYRKEFSDIFEKKNSAPVVQNPSASRDTPGPDRFKARIPETQSLQDKNSFFFLSLPAGFTTEERSTQKKSQATLTYEASVTIDIEARPWPSKWNAEDEMYTTIADLQTGEPVRAHPAIESYSILSLGGGQGYEISTMENINALLCKMHMYKVLAYQKMISITVSCKHCTEKKNSVLYNAVDEMIKKSLLIYP